MFLRGKEESYCVCVGYRSLWMSVFKNAMQSWREIYNRLLKCFSSDSENFYCVHVNSSLLLCRVHAATHNRTGWHFFFTVSFSKSIHVEAPTSFVSDMHLGGFALSLTSYLRCSIYGENKNTELICKREPFWTFGHATWWRVDANFRTRESPKLSWQR